MRNYSFLVWLHHQAGPQRKILALVDDMVKSQWLSADHIQEYQLAKLRDIISYAMKQTEHYRRIFSEIGLNDARDIRSLRDLQKIPPLTKSDVRNDLQALTAVRDDLVENHTGGSAGIPLRFYCNREFIAHQKSAGNYRAYTIGGYKIGERFGVIWGFEQDLPTLGFVANLVRKHIYKYYELNSFRLTHDDISSFIAVLSKEKPRFIKGYANSLREISRSLLRNNMSLGYNIDAVFSEAERLDSTTRTEIEKAFNSVVYDLYGSREFGVIAVECGRHDGLHVNFEQLFTEVMDDGKILLTSFLNLGTVFIRYEIGDYAARLVDQKCACGRSSQRLDKIVGRESDSFITSEGMLVHGEYITHLFYGTEHIEQFQVVQENYTDFYFRIVSNSPEKANIELEAIKKKLQEELNTSLNIRVHFVKHIKQTPSGKQQFTICNIKG